MRIQLLRHNATNSKKVFDKPGTAKVWHQRMGHCDMESIKHLHFAAEGVKVIKEPSNNTVFGPPLCEPCIMARIQKVEEMPNQDLRRRAFHAETELLALSHVGKEVQHMTRIFQSIWFDV